MNVNSGGPHILLFERDQQLTGLLMSEFQLAGYECHTARTAVEVFDAIARFQIRLVLVNLAQAAASRREFWVALDAQRRGRGVQVFTFRCMNLAGYGPDDPDERSRAVLTDMEVDGMLGVMNLVDAVRARVPGSITSTGSFSRISAQPATNGQDTSRMPGAERSNRQPDADMRTAQMTSQPAASSLSPMMATHAAGSPAPANPPEPNIAPRTGIPAPTFTDKIRAVIYPGNRSYSPVPEVNWAPHAMPPTPSLPPQPSPRPVNGDDATMRPQINSYANQTGGTTLQRETYTQRPAGRDAAIPPMPSYPQSAPPAVSRATSATGESTGLEQLSRMVRENPPTWATDTPSSKLSAMAQPAPAPVSAPVPTQEREAPYKGPQTDQVIMHDVLVENAPAAPAHPIQAQPVEPKSISDLDMRPSPIQDLPVERVSPRPAAPPPAQTDQSLAQSIASITSPLPVIRPTPASAARASVPPTPVQVEAREEANKHDPGNSQAPLETEQDKVVERSLVEQLPDLPAALRGRTLPPATSEEVLLDIVQSLPPMTALPTVPSAPPQTPVLSGRATRSLGNVLLEGHLVPQHRLEVAQNIQRMLRGVDLNYQLGEILLMFKLLTPDQLLAASLVSYGLISAAQISGLGRVRQELHMMGLEYDLESLLVLFRILTPEQLREVRASWSS